MFVCSSPAGKNSEKEGRFGDKQGGHHPKNDDMPKVCVFPVKIDRCEFLLVNFEYKYRRCCVLYGCFFSPLMNSIERS